MYTGSKEHFDYMNAWRAKKKKAISFYIDRDNDKAIIDKLNSVPNKTDYIRQLILKDIKSS